MDGEKTLGAREMFRGRIFRVESLDVELANGRRSAREIVRHPGAVVILGERPDGRFVLVRQFRKAVEAELLEVVAGTLDPGESPEAAARRELKEETGYDAASIRKLGVIIAAPGYCDERLHVYHALLSPQSSDAAPDPDESLDAVCVTAGDIEERIARGEVEDAKTLAAWMLYRSRPV
jgi:ADP-ribose pyrophosphatase